MNRSVRFRALVAAGMIAVTASVVSAQEGVRNAPVIPEKGDINYYNGLGLTPTTGFSTWSGYGCAWIAEDLIHFQRIARRKIRDARHLEESGNGGRRDDAARGTRRLKALPYGASAKRLLVLRPDQLIAAEGSDGVDADAFRAGRIAEASRAPLARDSCRQCRRRYPPRNGGQSSARHPR